MTMDGVDMTLVGSAPPTQRDRAYTPAPTSGRIDSGTYTPGSSVLNSYFNQDAAPNRGQVSATSRTSEVGNWDKPRWGSKATNTHALDQATRYHAQRYKTQTPTPKTNINRNANYNDRPASRTSNSMSRSGSRPTSAKRAAFKPSFVDEMLFGKSLAEPEFSAPWGNTKAQKGHAFDYTDYKGNSEKSASRPSSARKVPRHSASYVDETLFGPKPVEPEWEAPWSKPQPKRINIYDAYQHKTTIEHNDVDVLRPKSSVYMRKPRPQSSGKPVWR